MTPAEANGDPFDFAAMVCVRCDYYREGCPVADVRDPPEWSVGPNGPTCTEFRGAE